MSNIHPKIQRALALLGRSHEPPRFTACVSCGTEFSDVNVWSPEGWRETQISGMCEDCWDEAFLSDESADSLD